jgi:DNA-binding SARP family transcriptional activator
VAGFRQREVSCCDLFACGTPGVLNGRCLTQLALERGALLPEVRLDVSSGDEGSSVWVAAAPIAECAGTVVLHLRPGDPRDRRRRTAPHWTSDRELEISVLGRTQVNSAEVALGGKWLAQRTGQLLKYLVAERHRVVYADEIAEELWPHREQGVLNNVRYFIHQLRDKLEPDRTKRGPSSFVVSEAGGYRLNLESVKVDADRFERAVRAAASTESPAEASALLEESMRLYEGDFLADEPYALWALTERERLRGLAAEALKSLTQICWSQGNLTEAMAHLERLAQMYPFDSDIEQRLIAAALELGRQTYARRRYAAFKMRVAREFGQGPEFELADLVRSGREAQESLA